jgi:hypothetical protein
VVPSAHVIFFFTPCSAAEKDFLPKALVVGDLTAHGSYISVHSMSALGQEQQSKLNRVCYLPETTAGPLQELLHVSSCPYARIRFLRADQGIASATMQPSSGSSLRWKKSSMHYRKRVLCRVSKSILYSTNLLPSVFYQQRNFCRVLFSNTRQRKALGKLRIGKKFKKNSKTFFKITGTTLQTLPYIILLIALSFFTIILNQIYMFYE